ncbi:hypothetical protein L484_009366 [Morus notabilis]|uniref:DYW domain-containing protein n=1 Tax=Morus notabilis TaxID=981085 RepID=W9RUH8_9ROSA|nr:pentatricopeptide repeat-containing protein DOT4, chloroplastic [Morus notabilis]EXB73287.1 hypothetical protein L484_009366 [Morus notabilis]
MFGLKSAEFSFAHNMFDEMPLSETTFPKRNLLHCKLGSRHLASNPRVALKSADLSPAHKMFDEMSLSDTFAWNSLIQSYLTSRDLHHVLFTYQQMLRRGVCPDRHTLPRVLAAVSGLSGGLFVGKQVHGHAIKLGFSHDQYVISALLEMYGKLDDIDRAKCLILDKSPRTNAVSWTLLARLYIREGKPSLAIDLFYQMLDSGAEIDSVALATAISAAAMLKSLKDGRILHQIARQRGLEFKVLVSNSLLKMYIDCGSIQDARAGFDRMPSRDIISWTEIIHAYVKKGGYSEGLKLFRRMITNGLKPDPFSISSILPACARVTANKQGKEIHGYLLRNRIDMNLTVLNALIDMYAKSGCIELASRMFAQLKHKDVISWTVMILGYSLHGRGDLAVDLCRELENELSAVRLDQLRYADVLRACSSARKIEEGKFYFNRIKAPEVAHYALMVGLLANAALFDEAMLFIQENKIERHAEVLRALLDGCRIHRRTDLGKRVAEQLSELEPLNAENYVLLSNWYAHNGKWDLVNKMRGMIGGMDLKPKKAYSWIESRNKVHVFRTGDVSHPRSQGIYWELECLMKKMEEEGQKPNADYSLHDVDEERDCIGVGHSEMLAISFGLISSKGSATVRVTKNHRVCRFCHESAKAISNIVGREIILKDPNRFHHFRDGLCSCGDFW